MEGHASWVEAYYPPGLRVGALPPLYEWLLSHARPAVDDASSSAGVEQAAHPARAAGGAGGAHAKGGRAAPGPAAEL